MNGFESPYSKITITLTIFILAILCPYYADCQVIMPYGIKDLQRTDSCFVLDANQWYVSSSATNIWTTCAGTYLVGGYGVLYPSNQAGQYFQRVYYGLGYHTVVYWSLLMYGLDSWDYGYYNFVIQVGSAYFWSWYTWSSGSFPGQLCGNSANDISNIRLYGIAWHTGGSLVVSVISELDESSTNESFGFRELSVVLAAPSSLPGQTMCARAPIGTGMDCACPPGTYYSGGSCPTCHPNCATCWAGGANQCYECKSGYGSDGTNCIACHIYCATCYGPLNTQCGSCNSGYLLFTNTTCIRTRECYSPMVATGCNYYCESPCSTVGGYAYWDSTCITTCPDPPQDPVYFRGSTTAPLCVYPCDTTQYLYWDGSCAADCPNPPYVPTSYKGKNYCTDICAAGQYLYWDGTCSAICVYPLTSGLLFGSRFCEYPCTDPTYYLYWDGECLPSCSSPFTPRITKGKQFCDFPCLSGEFLLWYGSCNATCEPPYQTRIEQNRGYCDHPCPGSQYLYWNFTCQTTCDTTILTSSSLGGKYFCSFSCPAGQYLYWNMTCASSCNMPLQHTFSADKDFCVYPCGAGQYLYENGSCINNCLDPFYHRVEAGKHYCDAKCPRRTVLFWNGACIKSCASPLYFATNTTGTYCVDPCNNPSKYYYEETKECKSYCNTGWTLERGLYLRCWPYYEPPLIELSKLIHYIRYLNVTFPPKLGRMAASIKVNYITPRIIPSMFDPIRNWLDEDNIGTYTFQGYEFYADFLANFLDEMILLVMILGGGILCDILECFSKSMGWFYLTIIFERLSVLMKWNVFIILFTSNIGEIILYSSIEYWTYTAASTQENVSLGISILMLTGILVLYIYNFYVAYKIQQFKVMTFKMRDNMTLPDYYRKWQTCQVLFRGLIDKNSLTSGFYLIYSIRLAIPMLVASTLGDSPVVQTSFYTIISVLILLLIITQKPFKKPVDLVNILVLEAIIFIVNGSVAALAIFTHYNLSYYEITVFLGDVIIAGNYCINFLMCVFLPLKIFDGIRTALSKRRHQPTEELGAWIQLLFLPIQQGGIGFEQMELMSAFTISKIRSYSGKIYPSAANARDIEPTIQTQHNLVDTPRVPMDFGVFDKPSPAILTASPRVPRIRISQIAPLKKRKTMGNSSRFGDDVEPVEEFKEEDEDVFPEHRKDSVMRAIEEGPELATTSKMIGKKELTLLPNEYSTNGLDLSQISPFNIQNTPY